jgi:hypothetical protein
MALPTSGDAWNVVKAKADQSVTPNICDGDNKADVNALAAGIVYARTGQAEYRNKVISLINKMMDTQVDGCYHAVLRLARQVGGWVMAADFEGYRDPSFIDWLHKNVDEPVGGHGRWNEVRWTAYDSANNWGTFAMASTTIMDVYLGRTSDLEKDWQVFSAYGVPHGWDFTRPGLYQDEWSCITDGPSNLLPVAINPPCVKGGVNLDGAPVADASREKFPGSSGYVQEAMQGMTVMAQVFSRAGYDGWGVNDRQVCRGILFTERAGRLNAHNVSYYLAPMANAFCGFDLPTKTPTSGGRMFGFTDWLFMNADSPQPTFTPSTAVPTFTADPTSQPTQQPTQQPTGTPAPTDPILSREAILEIVAHLRAIADILEEATK